MWFRFNELNKKFENAVGEQKGAELSISSGDYFIFYIVVLFCY